MTTATLRVPARASERRVDVVLRKDGTQAVLEVQDCGVGIPEHECARVLQGIYRASTAGEGRTVIPEAEEPAEKAPELPDWLSVAEEAEPEGEKAGLTDWLSAAVVGSTAVRAISEEKEEEAEFNPEEELPDWLKVSPDETLEESAGDEVDELPEWLKSMAVEAPEDLTAPTFAPEASTEFALPEVDAAIPAMPEAGAAQPIADQADQDSALAWLEGLAAGQGVSEEELITPPGERSETPPDWIKVAAEARRNSSRSTRRESSSRAPRVYQLACGRLGLPPARIGFVSSNGWDAIGAKAFGFTAFWINRTGSPVDRHGPAPDCTIGSLGDLPALLTPLRS